MGKSDKDLLNCIWIQSAKNSLEVGYKIFLLTLFQQTWKFKGIVHLKMNTFFVVTNSYDFLLKQKMSG